MVIGGLQKFSLLDYPEKISAIIFTQGCNFRCHFCYNPMLVRPPFQAGKIKYSSQEEQEDHHIHQISEDDLFGFLKSRAGKLQAVVITGGEPTLFKDLPEFIKKIRELGFLVKLDTNGTNPEMIGKLIKEKLVDYIAMDFKAPPKKYDKIAGVKVDFQNILKSVKIIMESGLPFEFRTTIVPDFFSVSDMDEMGEIIKGADKWFLQKFKSDIPLVDNALEGVDPITDKEMESLAEIGKKYVKHCEAR